MSDIRFPWTDVPASPKPPVPPPDAAPPKRRGRRPRTAQAISPGWLYHHLTVSGPAAQTFAFAAAARGSGVIPWQLDFDRIEEDVFNLAASQPPARRNLSIAGCRILARQFCERVAGRQARAAALVGVSRACPFDLQVLLPVPLPILKLGPTHPASLAWLRENWGTTDRLRQVVEGLKPMNVRRLPAGHSALGYGFFTDGATPRAAVAQIGARWPDLRFMLQPRPAD